MCCIAIQKECARFSGQPGNALKTATKSRGPLNRISNWPHIIELYLHIKWDILQILMEPSILLCLSLILNLYRMGGSFFSYFGEGSWAKYEPRRTYRFIVNSVKNMQEKITETKDMDRYSGPQLSQI